MPKFVFVAVISALLAITGAAQTAVSVPAAGRATAETPKRGPIFRATKAQIKEVQSMLKDKKLYDGEPTGKLDDATRASIKSYQKDNDLKVTGTLNRTTLEKMGISLTDGQKAIPVAESAKREPVVEKPAKAEASAAGEAPAKRTIFRASKDQITEAQKMLKSKGMYAGEETGKLDEATRAALKKYQTANELKPTGTLNQATLDKMDIRLTEKQKADSN